MLSRAIVLAAFEQAERTGMIHEYFMAHLGQVVAEDAGDVTTVVLVHEHGMLQFAQDGFRHRPRMSDHDA